MENKSVKHAGCLKCGSKEQNILKSIVLPGGKSGAFCDRCIKEMSK